MSRSETRTATRITCKTSSNYFIGMLVLAIGILVSVSYSMQVYKFVFNPGFYVFQKLDVDGEKNIPAFFSTFMLITTSALLACITYLHSRLANNRLVWYWLGLSAVFLYLAMDELISIHEIFIDAIQRLARSDKGIFHLGWVMPMGAFCVVFAIIYWRFLGQLPKRSRLLFLLSGAVYVFGALGMEMIGSFYYQLTFKDSLGFQTMITIEETLEMTGITLFIYTLLDYIRQFAPQLTIRLRFAE